MSESGAPPRPPTQHAFGSSQVSYDAARVHPTEAPIGPHNNFGAANTVTADELIRILKEIRDESARSGYSSQKKEDLPRIDAMYKDMWKRYKDFSREFPVVFRWTVHTAEASATAFRNYLLNHHKPFWKDRKEMLRAQDEYLVSKYKAENRRESTIGRMDNYRKGIVKKLIEEEEEFEAAAKKAQELGKTNAAEQTLLLRQALLKAATRAKAGDILTDAPTRITCDASPQGSGAGTVEEAEREAPADSPPTSTTE